MTVAVGGELEAWCTTCKIMKDHIVVAIADGKPAKTECMGCHKQHVYRAHPPGTKVAKPKVKAKPGSGPRKPSAAAMLPLPSLEGRVAKTYSPSERFGAGEVVRHPTFGLGLVTSLPAAQKMEVHFEAGVRVLVHDRAQPGATLTRPLGTGETVLRGTSDAPLRDPKHR